MILLVDNYDSFTFNLVQYLGELGQEVRVVRNDALTVADIRALAPSWPNTREGCRTTAAGCLASR